MRSLIMLIVDLKKSWDNYSVSASISNEVILPMIGVVFGWSSHLQKTDQVTNVFFVDPKLD